MLSFSAGVGVGGVASTRLASCLMSISALDTYTKYWFYFFTVF